MKRDRTAGMACFKFVLYISSLCTSRRMGTEICVADWLASARVLVNKLVNFSLLTQVIHQVLPSGISNHSAPLRTANSDTNCRLGHLLYPQPNQGGHFLCYIDNGGIIHVVYVST